MITVLNYGKKQSTEIGGVKMRMSCFHYLPATLSEHDVTWGSNWQVIFKLILAFCYISVGVFFCVFETMWEDKGDL